MSRRGRDEGTIGQRKDGRWYARLTVGYGADGRQRRVTFYGATRADVRDQLRTALEAHEQGLPVSFERQTVGEYLTHWLVHVVRDRVRPSTYRSYEQTVRVHLTPGLGRVRLSRLSPQHVEKWMSERLAAGVSGATTAYGRAVLRAALTNAVRKKLVRENVAQLVEPPRRVRRRITPLSPDQARTLLGAIEAHRLGPLFSLGLAMGLRLGEALGLQWSALDFEASTLAVERQLYQRVKTWALVEPKSEASRRMLVLPDVIRDRLKAHRVRQLERRLAAGPRWQEHGLVFTTRTGGPLAQRNLRRDFQMILERAGLPRIRIHDLRHSCATLLLVQGVSPKVVADTLGHSDVRLTMNTYQHLVPVLRREVADRMQALLVGDK